MMDTIELMRLMTLKGALKLEILGMHRSRRPSAYVMVKRELKVSGNRASVLEKLEAFITKHTGPSKEDVCLKR